MRADIGLLVYKFSLQYDGVMRLQAGWVRKALMGLTKGRLVLRSKTFNSVTCMGWLWHFVECKGLIPLVLQGNAEGDIEGKTKTKS
jgi:hypothetical protein